MSAIILGKKGLFLVCMGTPWNPMRPAGVPQTAGLGICGQGFLTWNVIVSLQHLNLGVLQWNAEL